MNLENEIQWYLNAVRSDLILNHGLTKDAAETAMKCYMLKEKLEKYPDVQLHYSISSVIREMRDLNCIIEE